MVYISLLFNKEIIKVKTFHPTIISFKKTFPPLLGLRNTSEVRVQD